MDNKTIDVMEWSKINAQGLTLISGEGGKVSVAVGQVEQFFQIPERTATTTA
ncbi:MAG: hypothetical protein ACYDDS_18995 [Candidatus Sulfotelmatobacter sp.]